MRLDDVPIEAPCEEDWDRMDPEAGGRGRYCDRCRERVIDLTAMGEREARAFLAATEGVKMCIAYTHDAEGELVFGERPPADVVPIARLRRRPVHPAVKLAGAASVAALLSACTPHDRGESVLVVDDEVEPAEPHARPSTVIPTRIDPGDRPTTALPPATERADEPCEPPSQTRTIKKGKRKRMGRRPRRVTDDGF